MSESLFSPSWYRVAGLKPRLRGHVRVSGHTYRGESWYVLQDRAKGRYYRFDRAGHEFIGRMNGERTVQQIWEAVVDLLGDDALTQDEAVRLLGQLHAADVLMSDVPPDAAEILKRSGKIERKRWTQQLLNPLAIRIPLLDPERFLQATAWLVRPIFTVWGAGLWLFVVGTAVVLAARNWDALTTNFADRVLAAESLLTMALVYPLVKAIHELGHAYAVKHWGGEVHELGVMILVLMPIPYVDASGASEFRSKYRRAIVGAAGIFVELFLASVALLLWLQFSEGLPKALAYNVVVIASISTILFNGNPFLRYDGYYVLADLLEIPNLAQRGMTYLSYVVKRWIFGLHKTPEPHTARGERFWFVSYTVVGFVYRVFLYAGIFLFIAGKMFVLGVALALWAAFTRAVLPIVKGIKFLLTDPSLREKRGRALLSTGIAVTAVVLALFAAPAPLRTTAEGVVWVPEEAIVRAGTDGFVSRVVAAPDAEVARGDLLIECREPILQATLKVLEARLEEVRARYDAAMAVDRVQAEIVRKEVEEVRAELDRTEERLAELSIRSPVAGRLVLPYARDLPDKYLQQGDLVGFVVDVKVPTVRVVVRQSEVDLVRQRTRGVAVRLTEDLDRVVEASVRREIPGAADRLPSTTLGSRGGGGVVVDPTDERGTKTFERLFQFELELSEPYERVFFGGRAFVRFDHGYEPAGVQLYRTIRQILLRRLNV